MKHAQRDNAPAREDGLVIDENPDNRPRNSEGTTVVDEQPNRTQDRRTEVYERRVRPARTSTAATFGLLSGLTALLATLTVILAPIGVILSIVGLILSVLGFRSSRRPGITGRTIAISGMLLSSIALILGVVLVSGAITVLNDESAVNWMEDQVQELRNNLPSQSDVNETLG